eukprot:m.157318 g.157318  ORF g.157318 m.157318 type:complete len:172 (-) comp17966_c0_seq1:1484-1999(-)
MVSMCRPPQSRVRQSCAPACAPVRDRSVLRDALASFANACEAIHESEEEYDATKEDTECITTSVVKRTPPLLKNPKLFHHFANDYTALRPRRSSLPTFQPRKSVLPVIAEDPASDSHSFSNSTNRYESVSLLRRNQLSHPTSVCSFQIFRPALSQTHCTDIYPKTRKTASS